MDCLLLYRSWWPGETFAVISLHFPSKGDCTWFEIVVGNNGNVRGLMGYEVIAKFLNDNILLVDAMPSDFGHHVHCSLFYFVPQEAASTTHPSCTLHNQLWPLHQDASLQNLNSSPTSSFFSSQPFSQLLSQASDLIVSLLKGANLKRFPGGQT